MPTIFKGPCGSQPFQYGLDDLRIAFFTRLKYNPMIDEARKAAQIVNAEGFRSLAQSADSHFRVNIATNLNRRYNQWRSGKKYNSDGISIFSEDWDNLIILDACRFDSFKECISIEGKLESRLSRGSKTKEWIRGNFQNEKRYDTVYISDNPWYGRLFEDLGSDLYQYQIGLRDAFGGAVTHPETMTDLAIEEVDKHPNKRIIVHYLQPHDPWFDEEGNELFPLENRAPLRLKKKGVL